MVRIGYFLLVILLLSSCLSDDELIKVDPSYVFHDNNSKVWLIDHKYKNGKDFSPISLKYKEVLIFHNSGNFYLQKLHTLGDEIGEKGHFSVSPAYKNVKLHFQDKTWLFTCTNLSSERIILKPISNYKYTLELIPIPDPSPNK